MPTFKEQVIFEYLNEDYPYSTIKHIASKYNVKEALISKLIHSTISNHEVDRITAQKIADIAVRNTKFAGYSATKIAEFYAKLLQGYDEYTLMLQDEIFHLKNQKKKYKELLNSFDDVFSESDETPFSKESLSLKIEEISHQIMEREEKIK